MIILKQEFDFTQNKYMDINVQNNVLTLKYYKATGAVGDGGKYSSDAYALTDSRDFNLTDVFKAFTRFEIFVDKTDKFSKVFAIEDFLNSRDGWDVISGFYDLTPESVVIYFDATIEDCLFIAYSPATTSEQYAVRGDNEYPSDIIKQYYPNYQQKLAVRSAKRELLEGLDPNESLAYIEAQLDAITKALLALLEASPDRMSAVTAVFPEFAGFVSELNAASVFKVKAAPDCLAEIVKTKTKVRQLQSAYYAAKQQSGTK